MRQRFSSTLLLTAAALAVCPAPNPARADTFGSGGNEFTIDFVHIGSPNNPADFTGQPIPAGKVAYEYRIGKYEISEQMIEKANALSAADGAPLGITIDSRGPDKPATSVSWFEAARFVNWLNESEGHQPAYKFIPGPGRPPDMQFALWAPGDPGYDPNNLFRNNLAHYFLPSANEWYKAAFYDPVAGVYYNYPTGSDSPPLAVASGTAPGTAVYNQVGPADIWLAGGNNSFGTVGQGGNIGEWEETAWDLSNTDSFEIRGHRGGSWATLSVSSMNASNRFDSQPGIALGASGFRVASILPEPSIGTFLIVSAVTGCALLARIRT